MQVIVSNNRETVVVVDGELEQQYTMDEFISTFGEEALPESEKLITDARAHTEQKMLEEAEKKYLNAFLGFLDAVGVYIHLVKLEKNADDGVYPVQVVAYHYGHTGHFAQELDERDRNRWDKLRLMNATSQQAGYLPMDEVGMQKVMNFFEDSDRRRYARDNIRRMLKTGECLSVADLMLKRYRVEKKNQERSKSSLKI